MKISEGVEWGIHCCTILALLPPDKALPASRLAEYHGVPAAYLAKHLQTLARVGILDSVGGPKGGYRLARPAAEITMLEVVVAIDGNERAFHCSEIRQRGPAAVDAAEYRLPCGIARAMWAAEDAWRAELAKRTIGEIIAGVAVDASSEGVVKAIKWFKEAIR